MKIEYVYKKEYQDIIKKIEDRLTNLIEERLSAQSEANDLHFSKIKMGSKVEAIIVEKSLEEVHLEEKLTHLKAILVPETIIIIDEVQIGT